MTSFPFSENSSGQLFAVSVPSNNLFLNLFSEGKFSAIRVNVLQTWFRFAGMDAMTDRQRPATRLLVGATHGGWRDLALLQIQRHSLEPTAYYLDGISFAFFRTAP